jgi:hypothetical protein
MSIAAQDIFEQKQTQFAMEGSHTLFRRNFIWAVNNALDEYCTETDIAPVTHIATLDDLVNISANHGYALSDGIDMWLIRFGHRLGEMTSVEAESRWNRSLQRIRTGRDLAKNRDEDRSFFKIQGASDVVTSGSVISV